MWDTNCSPLQSITQHEGCGKYIFAATRASYYLRVASEVVVVGREQVVVVVVEVVRLLQVRVCSLRCRYNECIQWRNHEFCRWGEGLGIQIQYVFYLHFLFFY